MNKSLFVRVATVIFTIVGLMHLYRAFNSLPFNAAGWVIPVEVSWVGGVAFLLLAYAGYRHWR
ncbi:hypothetical protein A3D70_01925 [Candidatus Adlerbacteria bacterium RIFCSPHIGHO2_02_FULL_54_18]|uniref:Uncharacterized protein n=2 Tax=Candidatus Adleribacteriota TaxID=1752736 RepID=A0A1F4Y3S5_9BACT|nr:MAG: hypothetical protein A2949_02435 [Candidatus Adlerbacteria bacterium RIFCSPLOWO2_01_FULL_54_21b]OGC87963.1 MAG: hypothetical protein A3D70_01925 [Candidatus Adlerbacteria bacterium RIFCSPHIGHO2_02_FULL_54_18]